MWRYAAVLAAATLIAGTATAAVPVETRTQAVLELQAAIAHEQRALELLRKDPPRSDTAALRLGTSRDRLAGIRTFLSGAPGAAVAVNAIKLIEEGLGMKRAALRRAQTASPPPSVAQCSDGKDNDGDGITDWKLESGCTSSRDVRESSRFSCAVETAIASGRLAVTGSCSGAFSEVELTLLDGVQLNGRFDIKHAPSCGPTTLTGVRCKAKDGAQNPGHLIAARFSTTSMERNQRVQLRFFDIRKRQIGRFVVPTSR